MALVQIDWKPDVAGLRGFGRSILIGFCLFAAVAYLAFDDEQSAMVFGAIALVVGGIGLTGTKLALPLYWAWMSVAFVVGNIMSRVLVTLFYFGMITPYGLLMRMTGRDRLELRGGAESYWRDMDASNGAEGYERQF